MFQHAQPAPDASAASQPASATRPPFFIVGSDRSGTTMLRLILDRAVDGPAIPPETMFIVDFRPVLRAGRLGDHAAAIAFTRRVWAHPRVRLWNLAGDAPLPPPGLTHEEAFRWGVEQPFLAYMRREGKAWWADKTPPHIDHVDLLAEVFPGAKFVELVRDGRDVALSIMGLPFGGNNPWTAARRWAHCVREGERQRAARPGEVALVRYEDLVTRPAAEVQRLSEFLEIGYDEDMLAVEKTDAAKLQQDQQAWFSNLWGGINQTAMGRWRARMSVSDQRTFLAGAGPELTLHGYEHGDLEPARIGPAGRRSFEFSNALGRIANLIRLRIVTERGRELRWVVARRLDRH
ncbi:MAG: sulfotransferase [Thermoleophilia bacterium]|nr:sulfotransferase [Thermoleophilia bacterium]